MRKSKKFIDISAGETIKFVQNAPTSFGHILVPLHARLAYN